MKSSIIAKLEALQERHEEVEALLGDAGVIGNQERFRALSREYAQLSDVTRCFRDWQQVQDDVDTAEMLLEDPEMREMAQDELRLARDKREVLEQQLQVLLLPKDPDDERPCFIEVRAGTGGDEAAIFAGDLFRMYSRYAEGRRWQVEIMSANEGEHGGYKEVIARVTGEGAYGRMKFESGGHRVQRVPETESQGRIHTSACIALALVVNNLHHGALRIQLQFGAAQRVGQQQTIAVRGGLLPVEAGVDLLFIGQISKGAARLIMADTGYLLLVLLPLRCGGSGPCALLRFVDAAGRQQNAGKG